MSKQPGTKPYEDPEVAKAAGRAGGLASGEARRAKRALSADLRAREKFEDAAEELATQLLDAAMGRGIFSALDPKERADYAVKALGYAMGRPRQLEKADPVQTALVEDDGIAFVVSDTAPPSPPPEDES